MALRQIISMLLIASIFLHGQSVIAIDFQGGGTLNQLIASFSAVPGPLHSFSFYALPRTAASAQGDGWFRANNASLPGSLTTLQAEVSTWCRAEDYQVCLLFDAAGVVAGLQVSVSVQDFEQSCGSSRYPISLESQWRRNNLLGTDVFSATALFASSQILNEGGRVNFTDADATVEDGLFLVNGNALWAMPGNARDAVDVAYTKQGCVKGMGRHYFYDMSSRTVCTEHRPFFLLFDDVTGDLHGFGVTLFGKASWSWPRRWWLEAPKPELIKEMIPAAPPCLLNLTKENGMIFLHVYFRPQPWRADCPTY